MKHTAPDAIGLMEAAELAGVAHETIRNWAANRIIDWGDDPDVLDAMNKRKCGRRHTRYYYRKQIVGLAIVEPTDDMVTLDEACVLIGITHRTLGRIREKYDMRWYHGPQHRVYLDRAEVDRISDEYQAKRAERRAAKSGNGDRDAA